MNLFLDAFGWLFAPEQWTGADSIPERIGQHLFFTVIAFVIASIIAIPLGYLIGHTGKGREVAVAISGAARALPSFGLILLLVILVGVLQIGPSVTAALVILAIPSILAGAYAGLESVDRRTIDAARSVGMTEWQILTKVEIPLGLPLLISGLRSGLLQIVATATLAAYVGLGGLGFDILQGIQTRNYPQTLGGAIVVVVLALLLDALFGLLEHFAVPKGVRGARGGRIASEAKAPIEAQKAGGVAQGVSAAGR
ncbi:ABC transporter permease [Amnibacterium flavum]|uniref:Glycine/betaine ABC transporter permease n=1 Tax=Amnibacterium flavum TaxID=2173173 RepID=A0A2V1HUU7_9MICO|nr:ABC transporter permease subunit [Amnibacterium flavum]PVZ94087.1 glycine/betaine ABC transporter permease [Amnibacterium flavum]